MRLDERILLYDADLGRAREVCRRLEDKGHLCSRVDSPADCIKEIGSGGFQFLFIGRADDNLRVFELIEHAQNNGLEVSPFDLFDHQDEEEVFNMIVHYIEDKVKACRPQKKKDKP